MRYLHEFFKDKNGKTVILQVPNLPLIAWFLLMIISMFLPGEARVGVSNLSRAFLAIWAYMEITDGASNFRRVVGMVVMIFVVLSYILN